MRRDRGAAAAEYALVTAGIALTILTAVLVKGDDIGDEIGGVFDEVTTTIDEQSTP